jgi:hypothetical protein
MAMNPRLLRPTASGFNPKTISGLVGWWDANDASTITLNGSNVSQWNDKSISGFHVSQATAGNQPAYVTSSLNGKSGVDWGAVEGNTKNLTRSSMPAYSPRDTYVVADYDGANPFGNFTGLFHHAQVFSGAQGGAGEWTSGTAWSLISLNGGANSTTLLPAYLSPFLLRVTTATGILASGGTTTNTLRIGGWATAPSRGWAGKIYEMLIFSSTLSATEDAAVRRYLKGKWGV